MSSEYDEKHFTSVSFPFHSIKSCQEPHLKFVFLLNLCKSVLYLFARINKLTFLKVNIFYCKLIFSAFK